MLSHPKACLILTVRIYYHRNAINSFYIFEKKIVKVALFTPKCSRNSHSTAGTVDQNRRIFQKHHEIDNLLRV